MRGFSLILGFFLGAEILIHEGADCLRHAEAGIEVLPPFLLQYVLFVYMPETIKKLEF